MPAEANPDPQQQAIEMWSLGDYTQLDRDVLPAATLVVDAVDISEGDRVLDVACGTGNVALTAWRRGANVTGCDLVPSMLELAQQNAARMDANDIEWRQGDAADLPFETAAFDSVVSCFGHITAMDVDAAGSELVRVTKPGGQIAYTAWTPDGLTGPILGTIKDFLPPGALPATPPDFLWSDPEIVNDRLGGDITDLSIDLGVLSYYFLSPEHAWAHFAENAGPFAAIRNQLDDHARKALDQAIVASLEPHFNNNEFRFEYALVTATK